MANRTQIEQVIRSLDEAHPSDFFKKMDETKLGIGAVMRLLCEKNGKATAGEISEALDISTARVAVLIKKMVSKGLVEKQRDENDARVTVVRLTEHGQHISEAVRQNLYENVGRLIEEIGMEKIMEFVELSKVIKKVFECPHGEE